MTTTAQDRQLASDMLQRIVEGDSGELAKLLAWYREQVIACTVARMEREFSLKERKR